MQSRKSSFALNIVKGAAAMLVLLAAVGAFAGAATTYTENTIYTFSTNWPDGSLPQRNGLVMDKAGNIYGTTAFSVGYLNSFGTVFELTPNGSGGWTETLLHVFDPLSTTNPNDCSTTNFTYGHGVPTGSLAIDSKGNLYGTCSTGGTNGTGMVWELSPPAATGDPWTETILYSFGAAGSGDGFTPYAGGVTLASSAATVLYGTTSAGGANNLGTVYELSYVKKTKTVPAHWTETILHSFSGPDGEEPQGSLLLSDGSLYGWADGVVFELQPGAGGWTETVLSTNAWSPLYGAPVMDAQKNLYGTSQGGGTYGSGAVWELEYSAATKTYTEQVIYSFGANPNDVAPNWGLVYSKGSLFGATGGWGGPLQGGSVFALTYEKPTKKAPGGWQETDLYDFPAASYSGGPGWNQLIEDSSGNFYGMLPGLGYGADYYGAVFELSPSAQ